MCLQGKSHWVQDWTSECPWTSRGRALCGEKTAAGCGPSLATSGYHSFPPTAFVHALLDFYLLFNIFGVSNVITFLSLFPFPFCLLSPFLILLSSPYRVSPCSTGQPQLNSFCQPLECWGCREAPSGFSCCCYYNHSCIFVQDFFWLSISPVTFFCPFTFCYNTVPF